MATILLAHGCFKVRLQDSEGCNDFRKFPKPGIHFSLRDNCHVFCTIISKTKIGLIHIQVVLKTQWFRGLKSFVTSWKQEKKIGDKTISRFSLFLLRGMGTVGRTDNSSNDHLIEKKIDGIVN